MSPARLLRIGGFAVLACGVSGPLRAGPVTWTGGGGSANWFNPSNWDVSTVPGAGDDVTIPGSAFSVGVFGGGVAEARSIFAGADLFVDAAELRTNQSATFSDGLLLLNGGVFDGGGGNLVIGSGEDLLANEAANTLRNVALGSDVRVNRTPGGEARLRIEGSFTSAPSRRTLEAFDLARVVFAADTPGSGVRTLDNVLLRARFGDFATDPGVRLRINSGSALTVQGGGGFTASGFDNAGLIEIGGSSTTIDARGLGFTQRAGGVLRAATQNLTVLAGTLDSAGQIFAPAGSTTRFVAGNIARLDHLEATGGTVRFEGGPLRRASLAGIDLRNGSQLEAAVSLEGFDELFSPRDLSSDNTGTLALRGGTRLVGTVLQNPDEIDLVGGGSFTFENVAIEGALNLSTQPTRTDLRIVDGLDRATVIPGVAPIPPFFPGTDPVVARTPDATISLGQNIFLTLEDTGGGLNLGNATVREGFQTIGDFTLAGGTLTLTELGVAITNSEQVFFGGAFTNEGTFRHLANAGLDLGGDWTNRGTFLHDSGGPLTVAGNGNDLVNTGAIEVRDRGNLSGAIEGLDRFENESTGVLRHDGTGTSPPLSSLNKRLLVQASTEVVNAGLIESVNYGLLEIRTDRLANNTDGRIVARNNGRVRLIAEQFDRLGATLATGADSWVELSGTGGMADASLLSGVDLTAGGQLRIVTDLADGLTVDAAALSSDGTGRLVLVGQQLVGNAFTGDGLIEFEGPGNEVQDVRFESDVRLIQGSLTVRGSFQAGRVNVSSRRVNGTSTTAL